MSDFANTIMERRHRLAAYLQGPMEQLAQRLLDICPDRDKMNAVLRDIVEENPVLKRCNQIYVLDSRGKQLSASISHWINKLHHVGRDRSARPYFQDDRPTDGLNISKVYISHLDSHSCITALQTIRKDGKLLGYIGAEFPLLSLPAEHESAEDRRVWMQIKGDPSIRGTLFMQSRTLSLMDEQIDDVIDVVKELIVERGVFHAKLHFSSSRATLWFYNDPFHYRVHTLQELLEESCIAYPPMPYPDKAIVSPEMLGPVFEQFKKLRFADETLYLRSASINIINGFVALNFSCDGSHYMPVDEFLQRGEVLWLGA
jgi:hypothetical protein